MSYCFVTGLQHCVSYSSSDLYQDGFTLCENFLGNQQAGQALHEILESFFIHFLIWMSASQWCFAPNFQESP